MTKLSSKSKTKVLENFKVWIGEQLGIQGEYELEFTSFKSKYFSVETDVQIELILVCGILLISDEDLKRFLSLNEGQIGVISIQKDRFEETNKINLFWPLGVIKTEDIPKVNFDIPAVQIFSSEGGIYTVLDTYGSDLLVRKIFETVNLTYGLDPDMNSKEFVSVRRVSDPADKCQIYVIDSKFRFCLYKYCLTPPHEGVDLLEKLEGAGFNHIAAPLGRFMVGRNLVGLVTENFEAATTLEAMVNVSLRDLFDYRGDPNNAGADISKEFIRLGEMLAKLHIILEQKYHSAPETVENLSEFCNSNIKRNSSKAAKSIKDDLKAMSSFEDLGLSIRIYSTLSLDIMYRTDMGWCLVDFGQDTTDLRISPLLNLAQLIAQIKRVIDDQTMLQLDSDLQKITVLSNAWLRLNSEALIDGYLEQIYEMNIVPKDRDVVNHIVTTAYRCMLTS